MEAFPDPDPSSTLLHTDYLSNAYVLKIEADLTFVMLSADQGAA